MGRRTVSVGRALSAFCLCVWLLALPASTAVRAETIDRVLAVAAGHVIMLSDVTAALEFGWVTPDPSSDPVREVLSKLIDRELVLAEVDRYTPPEKHLHETVRQNLRIRAYQDQRFTPANPRRQALIDEWVAGLRRRGDFVNLYGAGQ